VSYNFEKLRFLFIESSRKKSLEKRHFWEIEENHGYFFVFQLPLKTKQKNNTVINALLPRDNDRIIIMATIKGDRRAKSKSSSRNSSGDSSVNGS